MTNQKTKSRVFFIFIRDWKTIWYNARYRKHTSKSIKMRLQNFGKFKIPFEFSGTTYDLNVTKYSTGNDVIHMLLHKSGVPISKLNTFGLFEMTDTMERLLSGNTLVYKIWRSWGNEKRHFKFSVKNKEPGLRIKTGHQRTQEPVECDIDALYKSHYRQMDNAVNNVQNTEGDCTEYTECSTRNSTNKSRSQLAGKQMVLARYLYDIFTERRATQNKLSIRENGDGEDSFYCLTRGRDSVYGDIPTTPKATSNKDTSNTLNDSTADTTATLAFYASQITLDTAFVKGSCDSDSDEGIDVTSVESVDLDAAFIGESTHFIEDIELDITATKTSQINVSRDNVIKGLFAGEQNVISEDDEMESFMHSRIEH